MSTARVGNGMSATLIGGPFDGDVSEHGDPQHAVIYVTRFSDGSVRYRPYPVSGYVRYDRAGEGRYVHGNLTAGDRDRDLVVSA